MKYPIIVLLLFTFLQNGETQSFYYGDDEVPYSIEEMRYILNSNPTAGSLFDQGVSLIESGTLTSTIGNTAIAGGLIYGTFKLLSDLDNLFVAGNNGGESKLIFGSILGGIGLVIIGNVTKAQGANSINEALNIYNYSLEQDYGNSIEIKTTADGIGLIYTF